jgi:hypothetical protein
VSRRTLSRRPRWRGRRFASGWRILRQARWLGVASSGTLPLGTPRVAF